MISVRPAGCRGGNLPAGGLKSHVLLPEVLIPVQDAESREFLAFEVFQAGLRIAARDPTACDFFETAAVSAYQRLNVELRDLLQEIRQRGTVY